jgi:hypothetical protein
LTKIVLQTLKEKYGATLDGIVAELENPNIETILSRVRSLAGVIGQATVHGLTGNGFKDLGDAICTEIGKRLIMDSRLVRDEG